MSIKYKYVKYKNSLSNEEEANRVRPQIVVALGSNPNELVETIVYNNYYSRPDAAKATEAVFAAIEQLLSQGKTVTVNGYGSFMLSAQFVKENIDNNIPGMKEKSTARRAENIEVKNIIFRASPTMKRRIGTSNFERVKG